MRSRPQFGGPGRTSSVSAPPGERARLQRPDPEILLDGEHARPGPQPLDLCAAQAGGEPCEDHRERDGRAHLELGDRVAGLGPAARVDDMADRLDRPGDGALPGGQDHEELEDDHQEAGPDEHAHHGERRCGSPRMPRQGHDRGSGDGRPPPSKSAPTHDAPCRC